VSPSSDQSSSYVLTAPEQLFPLTRHFSYWLTPLLMRTPLTPNQVTGLSLLAGLGGAWGFAQGTWPGGVWGGALMVLCYTLDNCDGEIARLKKLSSEWGAQFDDVVDWLVDATFFAALGYGTYVATENVIWLWLGLAATAGATIDYVIDLVFHARTKKDPTEKSREEVATEVRKPEDWRDWLIYIFHKLSRADFCMIVFALALADIVWILVPLGAIGAQAYWITDLFKRARGWHT